MLAWITANWGMVFAVLFALDQLLASIPSFKSNSVFQWISNLLEAAAPKSGTTVSQVTATSVTNNAAKV